MFKSNKAWRSKKPSSFLMVPLFSIFLLSCNLSDNLHSLNTHTTNSTHSVYISLPTVETVPSYSSTVSSLPELNNAYTSINNQELVFPSSNDRRLLTEVCLPYPSSSCNTCEVNNYSNPSFLLEDDNSSSDKLIADIAKNMAASAKEKGVGLSDIIGLLGFLFGLVNFYYARYLEISKDIDTYRREFWLKQVLFPGYIESLKSLITDARKHIETSNGNPVMLQTSLLPHFNKVRDGSNFFVSYQADFNTAVEELIDNFDDALSDHAKNNNGVVDASTLFIKLQSFVDEVFYKLDAIYSEDKESIPLFSLDTFKKIFFIS